MIITNGKTLKILIILACIFINACQSLPALRARGEAAQNQTSTPAAPVQTAQVNGSTALEAAPSRQTLQEIREIGTGQFVAQVPSQAARTVSESGEGDITLNFQNTDLREFIQAILAGVLDINYIINPSVAGQVTIETAHPITREEVLPLFENILNMNNAALVRTAEGLYQIVPRAQAARSNISPSAATSTIQAGHSIRIIPLQFIAVQEMNKILEPFISEGLEVSIDQKRNLMIISGNVAQLNSIQDTIDLFDVDWLRGMSVGLYPLDFVDPNTMYNELISIMDAMEGGAASGETLGGLVRIVPIERLNSILIISPTATALREVELWMYRLDRAGDHAGKRLYVYNVQNAKATDMAEILGHVFGATETVTATPRTGAELAPGLTPVEISNSLRRRNSQAGNESDSPVSSPAPAAVVAGNNNVAVLTNTDIKIIADDTHNSLVVLASPQEYKMVEDAMRQLDTVPLQVLIEASIIEVTLNNNLNYGVEWFFKNNIDSANNRNGEGTLDLGSSGLSALAPGFSYVIRSNNQVRVALNALQEVSELNVLSSPSLMVLDNNTATINVGDEIPVPTRQSVSSIDPNAPTVNEIQFRQTGVTLTVTPRVNSGGLVTMEIRQEVSNAISTTTSSLNAPTISQRQIESVVAINSGDTIVLGGLIKDSQSEAGGGVPGLSRIPILGNLFKSVRNDKLRTELLVLITPRVISNRNDANEITEEFRRKLQGLRPAPTI